MEIVNVNLCHASLSHLTVYVYRTNYIDYACTQYLFDLTQNLHEVSGNNLKTANIIIQILRVKTTHTD